MTTRRTRPGFTLLEIILTLIVGLSLCALLAQVGYQAAATPGSSFILDNEFDAIQEAEQITAEYRKRLDQDTLNLDSLLDNWSAAQGVSIQVDTIGVSSEDGSFSFSNATVRRVRITKNGQTITTYFTE